MNIPPDRIASVVVGDQALVFGRQDGKFTLLQPTDHPKLEDYKLEDVSRALETLTLQTVTADADAKVSPAGHAVFTTDDGLAVAVTVLHDAPPGKNVWARFAVTAAADKAKPEAARLSALVSGWTYQIGSWKEQALVPTIDDLKAPEPAKPAAAPAGQSPESKLPGSPSPDSASPASASPASASPASASPASASPASSSPDGASPASASPGSPSPDSASPGSK